MLPETGLEFSLPPSSSPTSQSSSGRSSVDKKEKQRGSSGTEPNRNRRRARGDVIKEQITNRQKNSSIQKKQTNISK